MFWTKSSGVSFWSCFHSVTVMQQSAFFRHSMAELAYSILFWNILLALGMAAGS